MTTTLHIEVPVADIAAFKAGFADHAEVRRQAGVRGAQVRHPIGDPSQLVVDLDFGTVSEAEKFLGFLQENVWRPGQPALAGVPQARILEPLALD